MNGSAFLPCWGLCKRLSRSSGWHGLTIFMLTLLHDMNSLLSLVIPAVIVERVFFPKPVTELLSNSGLAHCLCLPGCQPILPPAGTVGEKLLFSSVSHSRSHSSFFFCNSLSGKEFPAPKEAVLSFLSLITIYNSNEQWLTRHRDAGSIKRFFYFWIWKCTERHYYFIITSAQKTGR